MAGAEPAFTNGGTEGEALTELSERVPRSIRGERLTFIIAVKRVRLHHRGLAQDELQARDDSGYH